MFGRRRSVVLAFVLATCSHAAAHAQVVGLPVLERDAADRWAVRIAGAAASAAYHGGGAAVGVSGAYGLAGWGLTLAVSAFTPKDGDVGLSIGALVTKNLVDPGQWLVDARVGFGGGRVAGTGTWRAPIALGVMWQSTLHGYSVFRPWVATRLDVTHEYTVRANPVLSGGLEYQCLGGFTANATVERTWTGAGGGFSLFSLGVGLAAPTARHSNSHSIFQCRAPA
jgi:hypothetical protein